MLRALWANAPTPYDFVASNRPPWAIARTASIGAFDFDGNGIGTVENGNVPVTQPSAMIPG